MDAQGRGKTVEAVMFFNEHGIGKEMLFPEFEAVLDRVVHLREFADRQVRVVFVLIDSRLQIRAAVFFLLDFDAHGYADSGWNIPLRHMADHAGRGPDLGAGPIRLACRSQCPVAWHQMHLWDPTLGAEHNDLAQLRNAAKRNHLGLLVDEFDPRKGDRRHGGAPVAEEAASLVKQVALEHRQKTAQWIRQQRLRLSSLQRRYEEELARLRLAGEQQQGLLRQEIDGLRQTIGRQERLNGALKQRLRQQTDSFQQAREELGRQLHRVEAHDRSEAAALREQFEVEMQARIAAALADCQERLALREVELNYRNERDSQLQADIQRLTRERDQLAGQGGPLERLAGLGIMFVVYHPGAGHLTIAVQDIARYQSDPLAYVADKCFVSAPHYREWLAHYQQTTCSGSLLSGERCAMPVDRIDTPSRFVRGESDRCARHKAARPAPGA
jgi:hypothetical protein